MASIQVNALQQQTKKCANSAKMETLKLLRCSFQDNSILCEAEAPWGWLSRRVENPDFTTKPT